MYMATKTRTQLYLETRQRAALEHRSRLTGKSVGQLVRDAVDEVYLKDQPLEKPISKKDPLWKFVAAGRPKETDISARHDHYLYELRK
jgi:hypothetical protein